MGWLYRKIREFEWIVSLWALATTSPTFWLVVAAVAAVLTAVGSVLYDAASWINGYGRSGWILAVVAAIILVCGVIVSVTAAWRGIRSIRSGTRTPQSSEANGRAEARESARDETLRRIDRSIFLLLVSATDEGTHRALWKAYKALPERSSGDSDDALLRIANGLKGHESETGAALNGTRWWGEFSVAMADALYLADVELRTAKLPDGIHPMIYREYAIADRKREALKTFLENAISTSDNNRDYTLGMLRDQKKFHDKA
ncbi:hypothetical protein ACFSQT_27130 [Mesorhizobium calcicola]|uniref:Uncharacterized protein n=1 Tax=Mesorhizobium calcicola TaxID=1300310 RepID=A0ABW4WM31_9HYPH